MKLDFSHTIALRVRYSETDQMGYLYYGHYPQYYEVGRAEMIRSLGTSYKEMETEFGIIHRHEICPRMDLPTRTRFKNIERTYKYIFEQSKLIQVLKSG